MVEGDSEGQPEGGQGNAGVENTPQNNNPNNQPNTNPPTNNNNNNSSGSSKDARWYQVKWTGKGDWAAGSSHTMFLFYVLVLLAHIVDTFVFEYRNNWMRAILYLILFIISWFLVFGRNIQPISKQGLQRLILAFVLSLIAFLVPVTEWVLLKGIMDHKLIHILQLWLGFYPSYLISIAPTKSLQRLQKVWIGMWIILGVLFLIIAVINGGLGPLPIPGSTEDFDPWESLMAVLTFIWETFVNGFNSIWLFISGEVNQTQAMGEDRFDYATGGYYSGKEEQVEEQGVFIKNVELSKPEYGIDDPIELFYNLEMKTPTEKPVEVNVICLVEGETEEDEDIEGIVEDGTNLNLYNNEIIPLSCIFENGFAEKGNYKIIIRVSYEYGTMSRIESHFIDIERKNAYRAEGIDILDDYGKDSNPSSVYTQGPMKVGLEVGTQPIGIESGSSGPRVGFTLEGEWGGKIKSINELKIYLPEGLIRDDQIGDCSHFQFSETKDNQNIYIYTEDIGEIEEYRSFNCKTKVSDFTTLMGKNEISTKYIKVESNYIYEYEERETVEVT